MVLFSELANFFNRIFGKHVIAESIDETPDLGRPVGRGRGRRLLGIILYWATPFQYFWQVMVMSVLVAVMACGRGRHHGRH